MNTQRTIAAQIKKAFKHGDLSTAYKLARRYGDIIADKSFYIDAGYHAGAHRVMWINHAGTGYCAEMHNGDVRSLCLSLSPYVIGPCGRPVTEEEAARHRRILAHTE